MELPAELREYITLSQRQTRLKHDLKTVRQAQATLQAPVIDWMADQDVDVLKLAQAGVTLEKSEKVKCAGLSNALRHTLLVHYFTHVDNAMESPMERAHRLEAFLNDKQHRPSQQVTTLLCRAK